jgi:type II secretory pathway pseudopilin PulG
MPRPAGNNAMKYVLIVFACVAGFAVLWLIAMAVALPKLTGARRMAQEMSAVHAITTLNTAETQYYSQFGHYAATLQDLGPASSALIDTALASGENHGFRFELQSTPAGYTIRAAPIEYGASGTHTYYCDQTMAIRQHAGSEPAGENDPPIGQP